MVVAYLGTLVMDGSGCCVGCLGCVSEDVVVGFGWVIVAWGGVFALYFITARWTSGGVAVGWVWFSRV